MEEITSEYQDFLPDDSLYHYIEAGMRLYINPTIESVEQHVASNGLSFEDVMTFNGGTLSRRFVIMPVASQANTWEIRGMYDAILNPTIEPVIARNAEEEEDYSQQEELFRTTDVPDYMLRTEEDWLRYFWVVELGRSLSDFTVDTARHEFDVHIRELISSLQVVLSEFAQDIVNTSDSPQLQGFTQLADDPELTSQVLENLTTEQLLDLYNILYGEAQPVLDQLPPGYQLVDFLDYEHSVGYQSALETMDGLASGEVNATDVFDGAQADFAEQDFLESFHNPDYSLSLLANFVLNAAREGIYLSGFVDADTLTGDGAFYTIVENLRTALGGDNWTPSDFANLVNELTEDY